MYLRTYGLRKTWLQNSLKSLKNFPEFFPAFLKSILNPEHVEKNLTLIADVFPKLRKDVVR